MGRARLLRSMKLSSCHFEPPNYRFLHIPTFLLLSLYNLQISIRIKSFIQLFQISQLDLTPSKKVGQVRLREIYGMSRLGFLIGFNQTTVELSRSARCENREKCMFTYSPQIKKIARKTQIQNFIIAKLGIPLL